jgi:hypothetical protein
MSTDTSPARDHGTPILTILNTPKDVEYQYGLRVHMLVEATTYLPIADWQPGSNGYLRRNHVAAADGGAAGPARAARAARILKLRTHHMHLATANRASGGVP